MRQRGAIPCAAVHGACGRRSAPCAARPSRRSRRAHNAAAPSAARSWHVPLGQPTLGVGACGDVKAADRNSLRVVRVAAHGAARLAKAGSVRVGAPPRRGGHGGRSRECDLRSSSKHRPLCPIWRAADHGGRHELYLKKAHLGWTLISWSIILPLPRSGGWKATLIKPESKLQDPARIASLGPKFATPSQRAMRPQCCDVPCWDGRGPPSTARSRGPSVAIKQRLRINVLLCIVKGFAFPKPLCWRIK